MKVSTGTILTDRLTPKRLIPACSMPDDIFELFEGSARLRVACNRIELCSAHAADGGL
jgi:hypothetical protein